jgi:RepB DNA-primase from phage plasmid
MRTNFLDVLVPPSADGFLELRSFNDRTGVPPRQHFIKAGAPDREQQIQLALAQDTADGYDCYMGVAERGIPNGRKASCSVLRALFTDIDVVKAGLDWGTTLGKVFSFTPSPSIVANSGGGLHLYWVLKTPINLWAEGEVAKAESVLRRLAAALGGDPAATDVSRVLRVPGTPNLKPAYAPTPTVTVVKFSPEVQL